MIMDNKINIAELLKDCPSGMELDCTLFEGLEFDSIVDNDFLPIRCRIENSGGGYNVYNFTKYGCWVDMPFAKCVIFPKGKTTWEGFQRPFKDGDIIVTKTFNNFIFYSICKGVENREVLTYVNYYLSGNYLFNDTLSFLCFIDKIVEQRLATEEEKQRLFDAIKANGYRWNPETKTLEKLIEPKFKVGDMIQDVDKYKVKITEVNLEDECYGYESMIAKGIGGIPFKEQNNWELVPNKFDITNLKPYESRVLVRGDIYNFWKPAIFGFIKDKIFYILGGAAYEQCIPYKNNEHLLGTKNDCDDFYKTWE